MIIRGIHIEHWCCIAQLDLTDLPAGMVVLHGPNRTGKSSVVKALRGCLFDFNYNTTRSELLNSLPWNHSGPPKVAVEFETAGRTYRITKVFSNRIDHLTRLEFLCDGQWRVLEDSPKEASRRTRELLGADKSTSGLNQLLWLDQGQIRLPDGKELDNSLERRLVDVLGVMVTGRDLAFKQTLDKRCEKWFGAYGKHRRGSPVTFWEEEKQRRERRRDDKLAKRREIEQSMSDLDDCQGRLPALQKAVESARHELVEREQERERSRERRQQHQQALRDFRAAEQQLQAARHAFQAYQDAKVRWQEAEIEAARAEAARQAACEERHRRASALGNIRSELQAARLAEEENQPAHEELEDRRKLLQLADRHALLARDLNRGRQLHQLSGELQKWLQEAAAPDKSTLEGLRENRRTADNYRAQLHAGELTLTINFQDCARLQLQLDHNPEKTEETSPRQERSWTFRQRARVNVPDVGSIQINRIEKDMDIERKALQLVELDKEYRETVLALREQPDDENCLNRLTERWAERETALDKLREANSEMKRIAPCGLASLDAELSKLESQRQIILDRRPDLIGWQACAEEISRCAGELQVRSAGLQKARKDLEIAEKQANQAAQKAETASTDCAENAVAARTTAKNGLKELQRLGDELSLQAALQQAEHVVASAGQQLAQVQLNEAEKSIEQRYQAAQAALELQEDRLQQLKDEMNRHRGRLEASEGLHTRLADAEAAVEEADEMLVRERLEAEAHKHLCDLFETCRDRQVQNVMEPIGARVLNWVQSLGISEYHGVAFGERFLPDGLLRNSNSERLHPLSDESYGTGEQLSLLVRLAIGGILAADEPAVTILDDPLAHADADKHRRILDIMRVAAEGNSSWVPPAGRLQTLIFTCHPERFDHLSGVHQIDLTKLIVRET